VIFTCAVVSYFRRCQPDPLACYGYRTDSVSKNSLRSCRLRPNVVYFPAGCAGVTYMSPIIIYPASEDLPNRYIRSSAAPTIKTTDLLVVDDNICVLCWSVRLARKYATTPVTVVQASSVQRHTKARISS